VLTIKLAIRAALAAVIRAAMAILPARVRAMLADAAPFPAVLDYGKRRIALHVSSEFEYTVRRLSCAKEPDTVRWIEDALRPGDVFYDIGANVGAYSLVAAARHDGRVSVVAFEPSALNFAQLARNIGLNGAGASVTPLAIALGDGTAIVTFNYRTTQPGGALHAMGDPVDEAGQTFVPALSHGVLSFRLDDVIRQFDLRPPTHIKMDVDGGELKILAGARDTLSSSTLRSILVEATAGPGVREGLCAAIEQHGFVLHSATVLAQTGGAENLVFARKA
jgi:FkbM family methyltransferase